MAVTERVEQYDHQTAVVAGALGGRNERSALAHVIVSGLATGCIYSLVALSLVIVYNATRNAELRQGEMLMVSAFVPGPRSAPPDFPCLFALACGVAVGGMLGYLVERTINPSRARVPLTGTSSSSRSALAHAAAGRAWYGQRRAAVPLAVLESSHELRPDPDRNPCRSGSSAPPSS